MDAKKFSLDRISPEKAGRWVGRASKLGIAKIIVIYSGSFCAHDLREDENEEEKIKEVRGPNDYFAGILDVDEAKEILEARGISCASID